MNKTSKQNILLKVFIMMLIAITGSCEKDLYEPDQPVTDIDGNIYKTVKIGNQVWMAENLKVTKYSDGTPLNIVSSQSGWDDNSIYSKACMLIGDYGIYDYGMYYSAAASINYNPESQASTESIQGVCPTGWHIPATSEWEVLVDYLGGKDVAGGKMKEEGSAHWKYPNMKATNESGFSAFGGGYKSTSTIWINHTYSRLHYGYWWSSDLGGLTLTFKNGEASVYEGSSLTLGGKSVRCIKD